MQALDLEPSVEAEVKPGVDRLLGRAQGQRGTGHELPGEPGRRAEHVSARYNLVHQADPQGFFSVHGPSGVTAVLCGITPGPGVRDEEPMPERRPRLRLG